MRVGDTIDVLVLEWAGCRFGEPLPEVQERWLPATVDSIDAHDFVARYVDPHGRVLLTPHEIEPRHGRRTWRPTAKEPT